MTIPEVWYREQSNFTARENIRTILTEIGMKPEQFKFQSEPVAAAAYFCWLWKEKYHEGYDGRMIVIDYGGGTLDVTLCQVKNGKNIRTIESYGSGAEGDGIETGHAGSAFLSKVVRILCEEMNLTLDERRFALARNELESFLISQKQMVTDTMEDYSISPYDMTDEEQELFQLTQLDFSPVLCRHLQRAFNEVNQEVLERALGQIRSADDYRPEQTKIIFVGGFSNFCCVENQVRQFFDSRPDAKDPRFPDLLSDENKALAIAKGAALIADGVMTVDPVFPYEVGIVAAKAKDDHPEEYEDVDYPLIVKNARIENYAEPKFLDRSFTVWSGGGLYLRMYRKIGEEKLIFRMSNEVDLSSIIPEKNEKQNITFGLSLDEELIPTLYTKDENGVVGNISLNKMLEQLQILAD